MANNHYYITKGTYDAVINISNYNYILVGIFNFF